MRLDLKINVGECNGTMGISIFNNNNEIYKKLINELSPGLVEISLENINSGTVEITTSGKNEYDTLVNKENVIVKDKHIDINSLSIDFLTFERFHLYHSPLFFDPFFSKNETKKFILPDQQELLTWYLQILAEHENK